MAIDKKELNRLSPEQRIKKLKSLEDERKKEVDEIGTLIKESMKELKNDRLAEEIAPEQKAVDISRLFEMGNGNGLESTARKAPSVSGNKSGYQTIVQMYKDYKQLSSFYGIVSSGGDLSKEQLGAIGQIGERLNFAEKYMTEGEKAASKLVAGRAVLYKLKKETGME